MRYWKKFVACLTALMFIVMMLALAGCQFVVIGPSGSTGSDSASSDSASSDSAGSGGSSADSSGGGAPGEDESGEETEDEIRQSLYEAFELDGIRGLNATLDLRSTESTSDGTRQSESYIEATAAWDDDGVLSADAYYIQEGTYPDGGQSYVYAYGGFARDVDFFDGGYDCYTILASDAVDDSVSSENNVSAIRKYIVDNKDEIIAERQSIDWLSMICDTAGKVGETRQAYFEGLGVLLGAVEQVPAFFGGELDITDTGYTLTYSMEDCIDLFCNYILKGILEAVDEDPAMTCEEFAGLDEIVLLSNLLFADYAAEDMQGLLRVAVKELMATGMGGVPADVVSQIDFNAIFPAITDGQTAGEYLLVCVANFPEIVKGVMHAIGETDTSVVDGLTPRMWMTQFLYAVGRLEVPEDGKLLDAFTQWYTAKKADWAAYGKEASFTLIFDEDRIPVGLDIYILSEQTTAEGGEEPLFLFDGHLDFCYEAPELFDLTGYTYYAGERVIDKTYSDRMEVAVYDDNAAESPVFRELRIETVVSGNGGTVTVTLSDEEGTEVWTGTLSSAQLEIRITLEAEGVPCELRVGSKWVNKKANGEVSFRSIYCLVEGGDDSIYIFGEWDSESFDTESIYQIFD